MKIWNCIYKGLWISITSNNTKENEKYPVTKNIVDLASLLFESYYLEFTHSNPYSPLNTGALFSKKAVLPST